MKIVISPAKKMNISTDFMIATKYPRYIQDTEVLLNEIKKKSLSELQALWKCNLKLAELNYDRFRTMDLKDGITPAVLSYEGLQYQYMAPHLFSEKAFAYIDEKLRILSGFYGVLTPMDGIMPYRLEMQTKLSINGKKDLYEFWGDKLYQEIIKEDSVIINLASKEYSKCIEKYITPKDQFITIDFVELVDGKMKQKATLAKMARGEMVRYMAMHNVTRLDEIKDFAEMDFSFAKKYSTDQRYVFLREQHNVQ